MSKRSPQGLKPNRYAAGYGMAEAMPFRKHRLAWPYFSGFIGKKVRAALPRTDALGSFVAALLRMTAVSGVLGLTGCKTIPPPKPLNQLTQQEAAGYNDFQANCVRCHDDREGAAKQGPTLLSVYKNQYLPSGAPANDDRIRNVILHGRGMMPGLANAMSDSQIDDLLAYLKTL